MTDYRTGMSVRVRMGKRCVKGYIAYIIPAWHPLTTEELHVYFNVTSQDRRYHSLSKPAKYDRLVVKKQSGKYLVVPNSPLFPGLITED